MPTPAELALLGAGVQAVVEVDFLPPDDTSGQFVDMETDEVWSDWDVVSRYERDPHRYMGGVTSPDGFDGQSAAFVQIAGRTCLWIVDWTVSRWGVQPLAPDPESVNEDWVFLYEVGEPAPIMLNNADGITPQYRLSGTYVYGRRSPGAKLTDDMFYPIAPWMEDAFDRTQPESMMVGNLIEPQGTTGGGFVP